MKKCLLTLMLILTFFSFGSLWEPKEAQANEVEFELIGKLGGLSNFVDKESLGDPIFNVEGGLGIDVLFRFDMGVGIGINFNWTMAQQRLENSKLTYALQARNRWQTIQHPSVGITIRYQLTDMFDLGIWLNYGFGSTKIDWEDANPVVADAFNLRHSNLEWELQTFEIGLMGALTWQVPADIDLSIVIGAQLFGDFSRMYAADSTLRKVRDLQGRRLDENSIHTLGFNIVFGLRYDLYFNKLGNRE